MAEADLVIWGGGALLMDNSCWPLIPYWFLIHFYLKKVLRKRILAWSHGIELETKIGRFFAKRILRGVDRITLRDESSREAIDHLGLTNVRSEKVPDTILWLESDSREKAEKLLSDAGLDLSKKIIGFVPTFWPFCCKPGDGLHYELGRRCGLYRNRNRVQIDAYLDDLADLIKQLLEKSGGQVVLIPHYASDLWPDRACLKRLAERFAERVKVLDREDPTPAEFFSIYKRLDLLIASPLHDAMLALSQFVPAYGLAYRPKVSDFFTSVGLGHFWTDWQDLRHAEGRRRILEGVSELEASWSDLKPLVRERIEQMRGAAALNILEAEQLLGEGRS